MFLHISQSFLVISVLGSGSFPTIFANASLGFIAFANHALGGLSFAVFFTISFIIILLCLWINGSICIMDSANSN